MVVFERLDGLDGIPVYFQKLPEVVNPVSLRWMMFVGSADDETLGNPGIYHWFEHVPFRGTKKYPGGYAATQGRFARYGGHVGAHTAYEYTAYYAFVPKRLWKEALDLITDLMAQPLLADEDIAAERQIIREELNGGISDAQGYAMYHLPKLLWPGHPLGHPVIGSEETLYSMDTTLLRKAWETSYDRSRCVLLVAGDIDQKELLDTVAQCVGAIPARRFSERRIPASYGTLPAWQGETTTELETPFATSVVLQAFPISCQNNTSTHYFLWNLLNCLLNTGGLSSPLYRILREERKLVYSTFTNHIVSIDGGAWGFNAEARAEHIQAICNAFQDVIKDKQTRSREWLDYVKDAIRSEVDMKIVDPDDYTSDGELRLKMYGKLFSDQDCITQLTAFSHDDIISLLDTLTPDRARTFIFRGTGKAD